MRFLLENGQKTILRECERLFRTYAGQKISTIYASPPGKVIPYGKSLLRVNLPLEKQFGYADEFCVGGTPVFFFGYRFNMNEVFNYMMVFFIPALPNKGAARAEINPNRWDENYSLKFDIVTQWVKVLPD